MDDSGGATSVPEPDPYDAFDVSDEVDRPSGPPAPLIFGILVAVIVLAAGVGLWWSGRGGDELSSVTLAPTLPTQPVVTTPPSTGPVPSTAAPTTAPPTVATTVPPTVGTQPPRFVLPEPGAETWTVASEFEPLAPEITLTLAATVGDTRLFDGVKDGLRCVGLVGPGEALTAWCGAEDVASSFVADRESGAIVVELGTEVGSAAILPQPTGWTLASNGCTDTLSTILNGVDPGGLAVTSLICRDGEAFLGLGMTLFGSAVAPDGGGILAARSADGWSVLDFGTSITCDGEPDRCERFGVGSELFEALLPLPPVDVLGATAVDVVGAADRTADVLAWIGDGDPSDLDVVEAAVTEQLVDPEAEAPATVRRDDAVGVGRLGLLVVEIPQLDDAFGPDVWAIWVGDGGVTAFSWSTCRRGVTDDGLCV